MTKMKDTTETVYQRNSSETAQQNFVKLFSYAFLQEMLICFFKGAIYIPLELWPKLFCATQMKLVFCPIDRH